MYHIHIVENQPNIYVRNYIHINYIEYCSCKVLYM